MLLFSLCRQRGFRVGSSTKLDDRVFALEQVKTLPLNFLLLELYPNLYPVHSLDDQVSPASFIHTQRVTRCAGKRKYAVRARGSD